MDLFKKINLERNINAASHGLTAMLWFSAPLFLLFFTPPSVTVKTGLLASVPCKIVAQ